MTIIRPRRAFFLLTVAVAAVAVGGALLTTRPWGGEEAGGQPVEQRACNVVWQVPSESSEFEIIPIAMEPFNEGKPSLIVRMKEFRLITNPQTGEVQNETPGAFIDAETGTVLSKAVFTPSDEAALGEVLATIRLEPFDPATAPWPYRDASTAPAKRERFPPNGGVEIRLPDPGSGIVYTSVSGGDGSETMKVTTCKSDAIIDLNSGEILRAKTIHPDDAAAFDIFRAAVEAPAR